MNWSGKWEGEVEQEKAIDSNHYSEFQVNISDVRTVLFHSIKKKKKKATWRDMEYKQDSNQQVKKNTSPAAPTN